jgi:hypothetical protein
MRTAVVTLAFAASVAAAPAHAATPADILAANKAATGGAAWDGKATLHETFDFSGQGMTGTVETTFDLANGRFVDSFALGALHGANGFDGTGGWSKEPSGTVTPQNGADRSFAVNEAYRDANLWWRPDFGGARVSLAAPKTIDGKTYDVVSIAPKDGAAFEALFDARTHLLHRIDERQGAVVTMTTLSDYKPFGGAMIAARQDQVASDGKNPQSQTLTAATFGPAQPDSFYAMPKIVLGDFSIAGGKKTTFPFRLVNNHIFAQVKINGTGPYTFIFDTGGVNLVTPALAQTLGLKVEGDMDARGGGTDTMKAGITHVARVDLGGATITDQTFMSLPLDSMANIEGMAMPGMIGFETFRRFVTRVDYGGRTITLMNPKDFDPKDAGTAIPIAFDGNQVEIEGSYDGIRGKFTIDTGARQTVTLNGPFVEKNKLHDAAVKSEEATIGWGVGGPSKAYAVRRGVLKLGAVEIDKPLVLLTTTKGGSDAEDLIAGNVGGGILKRFVVTFDYEHNTMYLKPVAGVVADLDTFDRSGLWLNRAPEGFVVVDVTARTPGEDAGLKPGDIVTAVDGRRAGDIVLADLRERLRNDEPGTVVALAVKGKGDVKITLRELI